MMLAQRMNGAHGSETKAMAARAASLRAQGRDVISLSLGEPDLDTPDFIKAAARAAIDAGHTKYTAVAGVAELREAIARRLARAHGLDAPASAVTVGCGAKQVIFNALFATLDPGDEVIIPAPSWVSYREMVHVNGGRPVVITTRREDGFKLSPTSLAAAVTVRTRWLILNSPCNPTGAVYSATELLALGAVLQRHPRVLVLSDDIYAALVYDGSFATMAAAVPALAERTLTVGGFSKSHAMTGWRVGYGAGPKALIDAMNLVQSHATSHTSSISQYAAVAAAEENRDWERQFLETMRARRDFVVGRVNAIRGLSLVPPQGTFYAWVDCGPLVGAQRAFATDASLVEHLLLKAGVAVMPGTAFGGDKAVRVSFAASLDLLERAFDRMDGALRGFA